MPTTLRRCIAVAAACLAAAAGAWPAGAWPAGAAGKGYLYDTRGRSVAAPDAYLAAAQLDGAALGIGHFSGIADLFTDENGRVYIADTGNDRIVVLRPDLTVERVIGEVIRDGQAQPLQRPQGVCAAGGLTYICNTDAGEVLAVDEAGTVRRRLVKPQSGSLPASAAFRPVKAAVNAAGSVFVAASGIYLGLLQYDAADAFIGFFGANKVEVTPALLLESLWKDLFTDAQREGLTRSIPTEYTNLFIDSGDFLYTATATVRTDQVQRLNAAGENILRYPGYGEQGLLDTGYDRRNFGDQESDFTQGHAVVSRIVDVQVDADGILSVLDNQRGRVLQYDHELNPVCIFGRQGGQFGTLRNATCLEKAGEAYLVADAAKNVVTVYRPTPYMRTVQQALAHYRRGDYVGSQPLWEEVLGQSPGFSLAWRSMGRALLQKGDYRQAMVYLKTGEDRYFYSQALQEYRREFVRRNLIWLLPAALLALAGLRLLCRGVRRWLLTPAAKARVETAGDGGTAT